LRQLVQEECLIHDELFELFSEPIGRKFSFALSFAYLKLPFDINDCFLIMTQMRFDSYKTFNAQILLRFWVPHRREKIIQVRT